MLTQVDAIAPSGEVISLPIFDASNGYRVYDISGLEPVMATFATSTFANMDGEYLQNTRLDKRNISMTVGLETDYETNTVQNLRRQLYEYFMPKSKVVLVFHDSEIGVVKIDGVVESFEAPLFVKDPAVRISILNHEPDFIAEESVIVEGLTVPNSNEIEIDYEGSQSVGFIFSLSFDRSVSEVTLEHTAPSNTTNTLRVLRNFVNNDILRVTTIPRQKSAILRKGSVESSILSSVDPASRWMSLEPGINKFRAYALGAGVPYTIEFTPRYGGL